MTVAVIRWISLVMRVRVLDFVLDTASATHDSCCDAVDFSRDACSCTISCS